jgi:hypothetical protein
MQASFTPWHMYSSRLGFGMDANVVDLELRKRHSHILKQLPWHFMRDVLAETGIANWPLLH